MTVTELITQVDQVRPNQYDIPLKVRWLSEIEGIAVDEVFNQAEGSSIEFSKYVYEDDAETELMIPDRFSDIYLCYLLAKIDFSDAETENYNNDVLMYQAAYDQFAAWYRRNHMPKHPGYIHGF